MAVAGRFAPLTDRHGEIIQGIDTMIIAHRLSTVVDANEIILREAGRVIERGPHTELQERDGQYAAMWRSQESEAGGPRRSIRVSFPA